MKKLAIITTHPIQYNAPFFRTLTGRGKVRPKIFYTWPQAVDGFDDKDFGRKVKWDIPLVEGYDYELVENIAKKPNSKGWNGVLCPTLIHKVESFDPGAVLVYGWNLESHFKAIRYFKGKVPVWFRGDSTLLDESPGFKSLIRRFVLKWIYSHVDKAFYVGSNNKRYFEVHGLKEQQLFFAPHAVDNKRFGDGPGKKYGQRAAQWRKELGYSASDRVILFAGKFEQKKDPMLLLRAIKKMNSLHGISIKLLFVGNGPLERELKEQAKGLSFVQFLPFQNQSLMPMVYRLGDIFCLPSKGPAETWGLAINEAMASGRGVIASSAVGCAVDLITQGKNGYIFNFGDLDDLVAKIRSFMNWNPAFFGQNAEQLISSWSYSKICDSVEYAFET